MIAKSQKTSSAIHEVFICELARACEFLPPLWILSLDSHYFDAAHARGDAAAAFFTKPSNQFGNSPLA
jgi:hypothetical protein